MFKSYCENEDPVCADLCGPDGFGENWCLQYTFLHTVALGNIIITSLSA